MSGRAPVWDPALDELASTMRAAVFTGPNAPLRVGTVPRPDPAAGEILVKVAACGLCHSDLHYLDHGVPTFKTPPLVLGHEISGTVVRVGHGVDEARIGTSVLLAPVTTCGECAMCRTGRENVCARQRMLGNSIDGGFAEFVAAPARDAFEIPSEIPLEESCVIADALTTAFHAVTRRARIVAGETVVVVGCGGLGLNVVQVAALVGAKVIAVDLDPRKLALAQDLGAARTIEAGQGDLAKRIRAETGGGADVAIEAIGKPATQEQALSALRTGGRLVLLGFASENMSLPGGRVTYREITVIGTLGSRPSDFPIVLDLVRRGRLALRPLVTHRHTLESINDGFDALRRGEGVRHIAVLG
ncbi:MAG TPA: zinc-binding dehydrogenase [Candidatus Limnocylindria bacterium]|nr:zinc-binding dehydrogenase [Candidatus Limnocylindria bacterium]